MNIWRIASDGSGAAEPLIDSALPDTSPQFSPDGSHIVFQSDRSGTSAIWVCDSNAANSVNVASGHGAELGNRRWSPDGQRIAFEWQPSSKSEIYTVPSAGGAVKPLVINSNQNGYPSWSHDGRFIYFTVARDNAPEIWKALAQGGPPVRVGKLSCKKAVESTDGTYLYYFRNGEVRRTPLADGTPTGPETRVLAGLQSDGDWGNWTPSNDGIYYVRRHPGAKGTIEYLRFSDGAIHTIHTLNKPPLWGGGGLASSPDGKVLRHPPGGDPLRTYSR